MGGFLLKEPYSTMIGGKISKTLKLYTLAIDVISMAILSGVVMLRHQYLNPYKYIRHSTKINPGPVVQSRWPICEYKFTPAKAPYLSNRKQEKAYLQTSNQKQWLQRQ